MKWIFFVVAVILDSLAAVFLFPYLGYVWPPDDPIPSISIKGVVLAIGGAFASVASFILFLRLSGAKRLLTVLPALSFAFATAWVFLLWDYRRNYEEFVQRHTERLKASAERMARERQQQNIQ